MPTKLQRIAPFLWFDNQAEEAANFYVSIFPNSRITTTLAHDKDAAKATGRPEGSVMVIGFELDGQALSALNGGPIFKFNEAVSLVVNCQSQQEVDHYWNHLTQGGDEKAQQCGWLKDRYGVSWQVVPTELTELLSDPDPDKAGKAMRAMLQMKKIDVDALRKAVSQP
jgi:predicted 3-demethylubiquinone-9 3-methyltransferase (glyoxalase superfamily)